MSKSAETSTMQTIIDNAAIGGQFMDIMQDYMKRQDDPDFDVAVEMDGLYTDLSNLYFNNAQ
jgi:hypothetical protein